MSAVPQASLDPSATIGQAFDTYKRYAGVILPAAFGLFAIQALLAVLFADNALGLLLLGVISIALSTIFTGAIVQLVRDVQDGELDSSPGEIVSSVLPAIVPLVLAAIVAGIAIALGLLLLFIPGLWLMTMFAVVGPVVVIERPGVFSALGRSQALVKGSGWQVFAIILFVFALSILASIISAIIGAPFSDAGRAIVQWIANALLAPVGALATATAYLRLRELHGEPPIPSALSGKPGASPAGPSGIPGT